MTAPPRRGLSGKVALRGCKRGVVSVHGVLDTAAPAKAGAVKADVLVLTGGADPYVTKDQVDELARELKSAGARYKIVTYPGAKHSFTAVMERDAGVS